MILELAVFFQTFTFQTKAVAALQNNYNHHNEKAQLSLTNPRDAKACQKISSNSTSSRSRWQ